MNDPNNITEQEQQDVVDEVAEAVKAALLISGADKRRYGIEGAAGKQLFAGN